MSLARFKRDDDELCLDRRKRQHQDPAFLPDVRQSGIRRELGSAWSISGLAASMIIWFSPQVVLYGRTDQSGMSRQRTSPISSACGLGMHGLVRAGERPRRKKFSERADKFAPRVLSPKHSRGSQTPVCYFFYATGSSCVVRTSVRAARSNSH
jgi:hypothetical protein